MMGALALPIVRKVTLFEDLDPGFIPSLMARLKMHLYTPGEDIVRVGEVGDSMFFIQHGEVEVLVPLNPDTNRNSYDEKTQRSATTKRNSTRFSSQRSFDSRSPSIFQDRTVTTTDEEDDEEDVIRRPMTKSYFGEFSLILSEKRTATVRAKDYCDLFVLTRRDYQIVAKAFPMSSKEVLERAKADRRQTKLKDKHMIQESKSNLLAIAENSLSRAENDVDSTTRANTDSNSEPTQATSHEASEENDENQQRRQSLFDDSKTTEPFVDDDDDDDDDGDDAQEQQDDNDEKKKDDEDTELADRKHSHDSDGSDSVHHLIRNESKDTVITNEKSLVADTSSSFAPMRGGAFVIHPYSSFRRIWELVLLAIILYNSVAIPFRIGFEDKRERWQYYLFDYLGDVILIADVVGNFYLAYLNKMGIIVRDVSDIRRHYLHTWFVYDVVAVLPLDFAMIYTGMNALFRLPRLLKTVTFYRILSAKIRRSSKTSYIRMVQLLFSLLLFAHWLACGYYSFLHFTSDCDISCRVIGVNRDAAFLQSCNPGKNVSDFKCNEWLPTLEVTQRRTMIQYWRSLYFSISVLLSSGVDLVPQSTPELIYTLVVMAAGVVVVAYIISSVAKLIETLDQPRILHSSLRTDLDAFMSYRSIPNAIRGRVRRFLEHSWSLYRGLDPNRALAHLPTALRTDIMLHMYESLIRKAPLFRNAPDRSVRSIISRLSFASFPPNEDIFRQGQIGEQMYFLTRGYVQLILTVVDPVTNEVSQHYDPSPIRPGSFFGEGALLAGRRSAGIKTVTTVEVLVLSKANFDQVMAENSDFEHMVRQASNKRHRRIRKRSLSHIHSMSDLMNQDEPSTSISNKHSSNNNDQDSNAVRDDLHGDIARALRRNDSGRSFNSLESDADGDDMFDPASRFRNLSRTASTSFSDNN